MSILSLSEFESKGIANKRLVEDAERAVHALVVGLMKEGSHFEEREHATLATGNELLRLNWSAICRKWPMGIAIDYG